MYLFAGFSSRSIPLHRLIVCLHCPSLWFGPAGSPFLIERPPRSILLNAAPTNFTSVERRFCSRTGSHPSSRTLEENLEDLPTAWDMGCKRNGKGHTESWRGPKLHIDSIDGDIPVSALLTSASLHDSRP